MMHYVGCKVILYAPHRLFKLNENSDWGKKKRFKRTVVYIIHVCVGAIQKVQLRL